jgi:predicted RND superfamily exporter protein
VLTKTLLTFGLVLTLVGGHYSAKVYSTLRPDLEQLLPANATSVLDLQATSQRLASIESLVVVIESHDTAASKRFVDEFAAKIKKSPRGIHAGVEYRVSEELKFFRDRMGLYMDLNDLRTLRRQIELRLDYERELFNPLHIFDEQELPVPHFNIERFVKHLGSSVNAYAHFPDGYYASVDERVRLVLLALPSSSSALTAAKRLRTYTDEVISGLSPTSYASDLKVNFSGGAQNMIDEQEALLDDVAISTIVVTILVSALLLMYFRSILATLALLFCVQIGTVATFGLCYFLIDKLNANSAFLGSIVIGNGLNFGVILLARYLEERRLHRSHNSSITLAVQVTTQATWTAALAAGVAYGSLMLTDFRGFRQFGLIGLIGMIFCWVATFLFLPPVLEIIEKWKPASKQGALPSWIKPARETRLTLLTRLIGNHPRSVLSLSVVLTALSLAMLTKVSPDLIEADLSKLRSQKSLETGSGFYSKKVDLVLKRYLTPIVVLTPRAADATRLAKRLRQQQRLEGSKSLIASVQTLGDFVPEKQAAKIAELRKIKRVLGPRDMSMLPDSQRQLAISLLNNASFAEVRTKDLPDLIRRRFREQNGIEGRMVVIEPPAGSRIRERENLFAFVSTLRKLVSDTAPASPIAGTLPLTTDLLSSIQRDGPHATLLAFVAVSLVVTLFFRNLAMTTLALTSLLFGVLWLSGAVIASGQKINFLNFVALPITFGIGVDYGVNVIQRYFQEGRVDILRTIRHTGSAVAVCSMTTIIGYGSLLLAQNQAFQSFGHLAILGEIACLMAAIIFLPSVLVLAESKKKLSHPDRSRRIRPDRHNRERDKHRPRSA